MKVYSPGNTRAYRESFGNGDSKDDTAFEVVVKHLNKADDLWWHTICLKDLPQTFVVRCRMPSENQ